MKKQGQRIVSWAMMFFITACGSLKISPLSCKTEGVWGEKPIGRMAANELALSEEYYIWNMDKEIRLKEFLKKRNIDCHDIKKMRVTIKSIFFVKRELIVFVQK